MSSTVDYYNRNAKKYVDVTRDADLTSVYKRFESFLAPNSDILDIGCGSGRDAKHFMSLGYNVVGVDASIEMCKEAESYAGIKVVNMRVEDIIFEEQFNAIWACASLLHIDEKLIEQTLQKLINALKSKGIMYASWKCGSGERNEDGRYYLDFSPEGIHELLGKFVELNIIEIWKSSEQRNNRELEWTNVLVQKK